MPTTLLTETWTGTTGAAWPAGWTTRGGTVTIQSNGGRLNPGSGAYFTACSQNTGMAAAGDTDLTVSVLGTAGASVEKYVYVFIDSDNGNTAGNWEPDNSYFMSIEFGNPTSASIVGIGQSVAGTITSLGTATKTLSGTTQYSIRFQRIGTTLRARIWATAGSEPGTWDVSATISSPMSGKVGLFCSNGSATTARQFTFDDLLVTDGATGTTHEPTGIATDEAFGTPAAAATLEAAPGGIASAEAFGTPTEIATLTATPGGVPSTEAFGTAAAVKTLTAQPVGIQSAAAAGSPTAAYSLYLAYPAGIPSAETFGTPTEQASLTAAPGGIVSAQTFGTPTEISTLVAVPGGIASAQAFGTPTELATLVVTPAGIATAEALGSPTEVATLTAVPAGVPSSETFGSPAALTGNAVVPTGIPSAEAFGTPAAASTVTVTPTGIGSGEAFGTPAVTANRVAIPTGIASAETFGTPTELAVLRPVPTGIPSGELVAHPALILALTVQPSGIPTSEAVGSPTEVPTLRATPTGITSAETFGTPAHVSARTVTPTGIPSAQALGTPTELSTLTSIPGGIPSAQALGTPAAERMFRKYPTGIPSGETFGIPRTFIGIENLLDYVFSAEPVAVRWSMLGEDQRFELEEQDNRISLSALELYELQEAVHRWLLTGIEGEEMIIEIYASAGAQQYVGGTITEKTGKDISAATITMGLGSERYPGATWEAPDQDESGPVSARHVLLMVGAAQATPSGTYHVWVKIADGPSEAVVVRFPQTVIVK